MKKEREVKVKVKPQHNLNSTVEKWEPVPVPISTSVWPPYGVYGKGLAQRYGPVASYPGYQAGVYGGLPVYGNAWGYSAPVVGAYGNTKLIDNGLWNYGGYGYGHTNKYWLLYGGLYGGHKTVVQANLGHETPYPWGQPWGTYGAGVYGGAWGHHGLAQTVVPVSKQIAATPGSVHVAAVPVGGEKVVVV
ncbi:hypothetical protein quinque_010774 [Culex quinquefasciatus]